MRSRLFHLIVLLAFICHIPAYAGKKDKEQEIQPTATIPLEFERYLESSDINEGDSIKVLVVDDVKVNGKVKFAKGSKGRVNVTKVKRKGVFGRGGKIIIHDGVIEDVDGKQNKVLLHSYIKGDSRVGGSVAMSVIGVGTAIAIMPFVAVASIVAAPVVVIAGGAVAAGALAGGAYGIARKGKEAKIVPGRVFDAYYFDNIKL